MHVDHIVDRRGARRLASNIARQHFTGHHRSLVAQRYSSSSYSRAVSSSGWPLRENLRAAPSSTRSSNRQSARPFGNAAAQQRPAPRQQLQAVRRALPDNRPLRPVRRTRSSTESLAVSSITGFPNPFFRSCARISYPVRPGSMTSSSTRSNVRNAAGSNPSSPTAQSRRHSVPPAALPAARSPATARPRSEEYSPVPSYHPILQRLPQPP